MRVLTPKDIPGEYTRVVQWSGQKELLRLYQETPCTILEARDIIDFCQKKFQVDKIKLIFQEAHTGESFFKRREIYLPTEPLPPWVWHNPFKFLRVGLVLHEFSHILHDFSGGRGRIHGREFVGLFDSVMVEYSKWNKAL